MFKASVIMFNETFHGRSTEVQWKLNESVFEAPCQLLRNNKKFNGSLKKTE